MVGKIPLAQYLFTRLQQLGVRSVHGVPGEYNLVSLDYLRDAGLEWVGDANELNAGECDWVCQKTKGLTNSGYSADGYARVTGIGVVVTTFGVGELSAMNAIAGSFAEYVSVVHIVGTPSTASQRNHMMPGHTLDNGDSKIFSNMYKQVTIAQANLDNSTTAVTQIDETLRQCWLKCRPVYVELPTDMATKEVDATLLQQPLALEIADNDQVKETEAAESILSRLYQARQPILLIDGCVSRHRLRAEAQEFACKTNLPTFATPMGRSTISETLSNFAGIYAGNSSPDVIRQFVEQSDLVLSIGSVKSNFNTTGLTYHLSALHAINIYTEFVLIEKSRVDVHMRGLLKRLTSNVDISKISAIPLPIDTNARTAAKNLSKSNYPSSTVTHDYLWPNLSKWLKPKDIILNEIGTTYHGVWDTRYPSNVLVISQTLWGSTGYMLPAAQGAALALKDFGRTGRVILFEGDGASQVTIQAIATMLKHNLDIIIFLINNDNHTSQKCVHGMSAKYSDIQPIKYAMLPEVFGGRMGSSGNARSMQVKTTEELEALWQSAEFRNTKGKGLQFIEIFMPKIQIRL